MHDTIFDNKHLRYTKIYYIMALIEFNSHRSVFVFINYLNFLKTLNNRFNTYFILTSTGTGAVILLRCAIGVEGPIETDDGRGILRLLWTVNLTLADAANRKKFL